MLKLRTLLLRSAAIAAVAGLLAWGTLQLAPETAYEGQRAEKRASALSLSGVTATPLVSPVLLPLLNRLRE